jgi:hypothetical protein
MPFNHEKLTFYQRALEFSTWSQDLIESVTKKISTHDHLEMLFTMLDRLGCRIAEDSGEYGEIAD